MFNNCDSNTNGELDFYNSIKDKINVIFDVGCRCDTVFGNFKGEVHYFDPVEEFINRLSFIKNENSKSYFNCFGLSDENTETFYYPRYQSFYDRVPSCGISDEANKIVLKIKKADEYIKDNNIETIDFLKIDTEGYELKVIKGFGSLIKNVKIIQFEYGGTFKDNNTNLIDVINYLKEHGFENFNYLIKDSMVPLNDFYDHYQYCNIVCFNKNYQL